ncbi:hypothetical protein F5B17DRAFT_153529 [Nemania serpens]|nr:hypothetical protein F5B17DRAFT_153529 [Nemania serpens]
MSGVIRELYERYDNSQETPSPFNSQTAVEGICLTFATISWICVALRIHTRYRLECLGWDDFFVVVFRATATVGTVFVLLLFNHGFGQHFWEIDLANQVRFQKSYYVALLSYTVSTALMKLCLLTQYLRLFHDDPTPRKVCWLFIVVSAVWGVAFSAIAVVPCVPLSGFWDWTAPARCYGFGSKVSDEIAGTYAAHVSTNVVLDLIVLAIPIPLYCRTFKQNKQRVGFTIMILLGVGINIISIFRLYTIIKYRAGTYPVIDPTFYGPQSIVLAALEVDLASIVASVPVFWPVLTHGWDAIFVTQEVHVTRHHRRLSGHDHHNDHFELGSAFSPSRRSSRTRNTNTSDTSDDGASLKLVIMDTNGKSRATTTTTTTTPSPSPPYPPTAERQSGRGAYYDYDRNDPYVRGRVYPLEGGGLMVSEAQVVSEGQRGFERNAHAHARLAAAATMMIGGDGGGGRGRPSAEPRCSTSKDGCYNSERSWSLSVSRKSSQRF